nr:copper resistance protein CopC [Actinomycetales bacterium]
MISSALRPGAPRALTLLAAGLLFLLAVLVPAPPARAHDFLVSSIPAEGETHTEFPPRIELEFSADIIPASPAILIQDATGAAVWEATPELTGRVASAAFPQLPDGDYSLNWSLVSSDGHRVEGAIPFVLATGLTESPATAEPGAGPTAGAGTGPGDEVTTTGPGEGTSSTGETGTPAPGAESEPAVPETTAGLSTLARIGIGAGGFIAAAVLVTIMLRKQGRGLGR